jgi:hypothetical protein
VRQSNTTPCNHGSEGCDVGQPVEGVVGTLLAASEVSEAGEQGADSQGVDGNTVRHHPGQNAGGLAFLGEHEERTRRGVQELVAGGERRSENDSVFNDFSTESYIDEKVLLTDDVVEHLDARGLDDDDERRLSSGTGVVRVGLKEILVIAGQAHADEQEGKDVYE